MAAVGQSIVRRIAATVLRARRQFIVILVRCLASARLAWSWVVVLAVCDGLKGVGVGKGTEDLVGEHGSSLSFDTSVKHCGWGKSCTERPVHLAS